MKKLLFFILLFLALPVQAKDFELKTLIAVDEKATIKTEKFDYVDMYYSSKYDDNGNGIIHFGSVHNNNEVIQTPISINVLLFDFDRKNIGYVTYCTDRDYSTSYSYYKLKGGQSIPFKINVTSRYFVERTGPKDVYYIAVMDENPYCQIGGYTKYAGQTIEEIRGDKDVKTDDKSFSIEKILSVFTEDVVKKIIIGAGAFFVYIIVSGLVDSLYQKMYTHNSILPMIPIVNIIITVKLVFGNIVAIIYGVLLAIALVLFFLLHIPIVLYIVLGLWGLCLLLVIIKLITKKYDLFYIEPSMDTSNYMKSEPNQVNTTVSYTNNMQEESLLDEESQPISMGSSNEQKREANDIDSILKSLENPDDGFRR